MPRSHFFPALLVLVSCTALAGPRYTVHGVTADGRRVTVPPDVYRPWAKDMLTYPQPELPASLRTKHLGGEALCRIVLDASSGTVRDVVIAKSSGYPELDASIRRTVRRWTVRPKTWREFEIYIGIWPPRSGTRQRPNQTMQATAGRSVTSRSFMTTSPFQVTLALASGA